MTEALDWVGPARALADGIGGAGRPGERLREAFAAVPRHLFVPEILDEDVDESGKQHIAALTPSDPGWLHRVYADEPLVIQYKPVDDASGRLGITSSSTQPSLMADMIEELDIRPGMRVLEVGTGTGYNAAILCHLLGADRVTTIDIDPELVAVARRRLEDLGYQPSSSATDSAYERVLVTHSVESIPYQWIRWCRPGGVILSDLRPVGHHGVGAWAKLTVGQDGRAATGRLLVDRGGFMPARTTVSYAAARRTIVPRDERLYRGRMLYPRGILDHRGFAFALWRAVPGLRWAGDDQNTYLTDSDRQLWTNIQDGEVWCSLRGDLWAEVEDCYETWEGDGKPDLDAYLITVTPDERTHIELDQTR